MQLCGLTHNFVHNRSFLARVTWAVAGTCPFIIFCVLKGIPLFYFRKFGHVDRPLSEHMVIRTSGLRGSVSHLHPYASREHWGNTDFPRSLMNVFTFLQPAQWAINF